MDAQVAADTGEMIRWRFTELFRTEKMHFFVATQYVARGPYLPMSR
jgi:hypothetical protein